MTAENNSLMVKDLILEDDEFNELKNKPKNRQAAARYVYNVVMESGCDFAIERREMGKRKVTRLVILVSQEQYYIENGSSKAALTRSSFKSFLNGLSNGERIFLKNVNWLDHLENNRSFCSRFMDILSGDWRDCLRERLDMIRHGDFYFTNDDTFHRRSFGEERYVESDHICTCDFAPHEDNEHIFNRFGNPQDMDVHRGNVDPFGNPFARLNAAFYDPEGDFDVFDPIYRVRLYGDYNPSGINEDGGIDGISCYEKHQQSMFVLSASLYRYMLQMMSKRLGISKKVLLRDIIPDWETQESMLFQSFGAFSIIQQAFGADVAKRAMNIYIESDVRDIIPAGRMLVFLYGIRPCYVLPPYFGGEFGRGFSVDNRKPVYEFDNGSFLDYLLKSSVKQGYGKNMNLFLYQWGQVMFLQDVLELKKIDKYPKHLASKNVELMSMITDYTSQIEKRMWRDAVNYAKPLEYKNDKYQIMVPHSTNDLIKEASNQGNCLRTYESQILRRDTRVCFLRSTDTKKADRSLVTIEVDNDDRVIQCKARFNSDPSYALWKFILEWEKAKSLTDATYNLPAELREGHPLVVDMEDEED